MNNQRRATLPALPVLFMGHGSPMNAVQANRYTLTWRELGQELLPRTRVVLIVSAHWATRHRLAVSTAARPGLLYDFYGFPQSLYDVRYDPPGDPELAGRVRDLFAQADGPEVDDDPQRPLDHGAWSILKHMFPDADVPCVQLSYDFSAPLAEQLLPGRLLAPLRDEGVLLLASGNIVHNLREIEFDEQAPARAWAVEFDALVADRLREADNGAAARADLLRTLCDVANLGEAARRSVPTPDHYIPFLNFLGAIHPEDSISFVCEGIQNASISMRSVRAG
jgi:4,5-DOPA dioxygenase extradiol